jgi:hypothetical protein
MNWTSTAPISHHQAPPSASPRPSRGTSRSLLLPLRVSRRRVSTRPKAISSPLPRTCPQPTQRQVFEHEVTRALEIRPSWRLRFSFRTFYTSRFAPHELRLACIQPLSFLSLVDSCCAMDACNPIAFNRLRTLSIAMGVYTLYPECFSPRATPHGARWAPLRLQQIRFYPLSLCAVADHFLHNEGGTPHSHNSFPPVYPDCASRAHLRTNCAISCPEPQRGVRNNSFLPRAEGKGALPHSCPESIRGVRFSWGGGEVG